MTSSTGDAAIVPITLTVNGRIGLTLYAPPWEDEDGEEWQGFLGDGCEDPAVPGRARAGRVHRVGRGERPVRPPGLGLRAEADAGRAASRRRGRLRPRRGLRLGVRRARPGARVGAGQRRRHGRPDRRLLRRRRAAPAGRGHARAYAELVDDEVSYHGKDGRRAWNELGDTIAESWERAIGYVDRWLSWQGDFSVSDLESRDRLGPRRRRADRDPARRRHLLHRARLRPRRHRGRSRPPRSSAATTRSRCSPRSPTSRTTAARPRSTGWSSSSGGRSSPTSRTTRCSRPGLDANYDLRKPSARGAELLRELDRVLRPRPRHVGAGRLVHRPRRLARRARRGQGCLQLED